MSLNTPQAKTPKRSPATPSQQQIEMANLKQQIMDLLEEKSQREAEIESLKEHLNKFNDYIPKNEFDELFAKSENDKKELIRFKELYQANLKELESNKKLSDEQRLALSSSQQIEKDKNSTENSSENAVLNATNKALRKELDAAREENIRLMKELNEQKENFQKEIESISSKIAKPETNIDELMADLNDQKEINARLCIENSRLKNSLEEKHKDLLNATKLDVSDATNANATLKMFSDLRKEYGAYKRDAEEKITELNLITSTLSKLYECPKEEIIACAQKNAYKVRELNRVAIKLAEEEIKSFDYMTRYKKLEQEILEIKSQAPETNVSFGLKMRDLAKTLSARAKVFEDRVTQKIGEIQEKSNNVSMRTNKCCNSILASPMLNSKQDLSPNPSLLSSSPTRRTKSTTRSPLSPRSNSILLELNGIRTPSVNRSNTLIPVIPLDPHSFD